MMSPITLSYRTDSSLDTSENTLPWILLIVVIIMIRIMALLVMFLWMRRKNIRSRKAMEKSDNMADIEEIQPIEDVYRQSVQSVVESESSFADWNNGAGAEGSNSKTVHEDYVRMDDDA